jgi:hypothetical protein
MNLENASPKHSIRQARRAGALAAALLALLLAFPALAAAELQTINFDNAPPPPNQPVEKSAEAPKIAFLPRVGFRPYRAELPGGNAKSGQFVGDLGRCVEEAIALGEEPGGCEQAHPQTTAELSETAGLVTLFAGTFSGGGEATLRAFNSAGEEVAHDGPKPVSPAQVRTQFSVQPLSNGLPANNIARFTVEGRGALAIDAVTANFPGGGAPDFSISTTGQAIPVVQGQTAQVPVHISRLNGSSGAIALSVTGLPEGVKAFPKEVKDNSETDVAISLEAEPGAPDTDFHPTEAKITASPRVQTAGRTIRTANFKVRVARDFSLSSGEVSEDEEERKVPVFAPDCAPVEVPIGVARDIAMRRDVNLSVENGEAAPEGGAIDPHVLPEGLRAEFLPDSTVRPGGNLVAERTLRLRAGPESELGGKLLPLTVAGSDDPRNPSHRLELQVSRTVDATIAGNSGPFGYTPRFGQPGSVVRLHGAGFCPGTVVEVGNDRAKVPATLVDDHTLEFRVPRLATTGKVRIDPPGKLSRFPYKTDETLVVDNVRNVNGFAFDNYTWRGRFGIDEFAKAFGDNELFARVNPCWPFYDCSVSTGVLSPGAAVDWGWMNVALTSHGGGHCFGMTLAIQMFDRGQEPRRNYTDVAGARSGYEMSPSGGPGGVLNDFLDAMHARQYSEEYMSARLDRPESWQKQEGVLEAEFRRGRMPMIVLEPDSVSTSHDVLAYDMAQEGDTDRIYVYDPNKPVVGSEENENGNSLVHSDNVELSTIVVDKKTGAWSFPFNREKSWSNSANSGSIWVVPTDTIPTDPRLPDAGTQTRALGRLIGIGSVDGSVRVQNSSRGSEFMPSSDGSGAAGNGVVATHDARRPLSATLRGTEAGHYTEALMSPGFSASAGSVATRPGIVDEVSGDGDSMTFEGGIARSLKLQAAQRLGGSASNAASVQTDASAHGEDTLGFASNGDLTYAHAGAATRIRFTYTKLRRQGGPSTFVSPPLAIGDGAELRVRPLDRDLDRVRVEIRGGTSRTLVLRNRGGAPGRLKLGAPKLSGRRLSLRYRVSRLHGAAMVGAVLRLVRGNRVVAHHALAQQVRNGAHELRWKLPRGLKPGRLDLRTDLRLISTGAVGSGLRGSAVAHRIATVRGR